MDTNRFDSIIRSLVARRTALALLFSTALASQGAGDTGARRKRKRRKKRSKSPSLLVPPASPPVPVGCPDGTKPCGSDCIPQGNCCTSADCGPFRLCSLGVCVIGQGTCPADANPCATVGAPFHPCGAGGSICECFRNTVGEVRCTSGMLSSGCRDCITDDDCQQKFPDTPGAFCARLGPNCPCPNPSDTVCMRPCPG